MEHEIATLFETSSPLLGLTLSVSGGVVAATHAYAKSRKLDPQEFDLVDFGLLSISGSFSGFIGFLLASWQLTEESVILAITGLSAIGGYGMLIAVKDIALDALRSRFVEEPPHRHPRNHGRYDDEEYDDTQRERDYRQDTNTDNEYK